MEAIFRPVVETQENVKLFAHPPQPKYGDSTVNNIFFYIFGGVNLALNIAMFVLLILRIVQMVNEIDVMTPIDWSFVIFAMLFTLWKIVHHILTIVLAIFSKDEMTKSSMKNYVNGAWMICTAISGSLTILLIYSLIFKIEGTGFEGFLKTMLLIQLLIVNVEYALFLGNTLFYRAIYDPIHVLPIAKQPYYYQRVQPTVYRMP
jgi:hypothetical protein